MPQPEKPLFGKLYGIRLRTKKDKKIQDILSKIHKEKNIPLDRLILNYLEKGLNLDQIEENQQINFSDLTNIFDNFLNEINRKIDKLGRETEIREFEKEESLKNLTYNFLHDELNRNMLFLDILKTQIQSEMELCEILFTLYDYETKKSIGYFFYVCEKSKLKPSPELFSKMWEDLIKKFLFEWYYELKINGVIQDLKDLKNLRINYNLLEKYIFSSYKGNRILSSRRQNNIDLLKKINAINKIKLGGFKSTFLRRLETLFKEIFKYKSHEFKDILFIHDTYENYEKYKIFEAFNFKPLILKKILDLDYYYQYLIRDEENKKAFSYGMAQYLILYHHFNNYVHFPSLHLITQISIYFNEIKSLQDFFSQINEAVKEDKYSFNYLKLIGMFLKSLKLSKSYGEYIKNLLNNVPIKRFDELLSYSPRNYDDTILMIQEKLKIEGFDLNQEYESLKNLTNKILTERTELFKTSIKKELND